ncbi:MAG: hypothetical protein AB1497_12275 [Bacillota bacterium]
MVDRTVRLLNDLFLIGLVIGLVATLAVAPAILQFIEAIFAY